MELHDQATATVVVIVRSILIAKWAKNATDPIKLVIVRDRRLTGFDAPCMHAMYVDQRFGAISWAAFLANLHGDRQTTSVDPTAIRITTRTASRLRIFKAKAEGAVLAWDLYRP